MAKSKRRDHTWKKPFEVTKTYSLEHIDGHLYQGEMRSIAANESDALLSGFLAFCVALAEEGVHIPRTLRRMKDDGKGGRKGTDA
jgi:hypothetical protein